MGGEDTICILSPVPPNSTLRPAGCASWAVTLLVDDARNSLSHHPAPSKMARIYIGNLPMDVTEKDMDDVFYKFGRIVDIDLKTPARPPAFGFITFQDARDAEEAVRAR